MRRLLSVLPLLFSVSVLVTWTPARAANAEPFAFTPPPAWTDLLTSTSTAIPMERLLAIRSGSFAAFYVDLQPMFALKPGAMGDSFNAIVTDEVVLIDDDFLNRYEDEIRNGGSRSWFTALDVGGPAAPPTSVRIKTGSPPLTVPPDLVVLEKAVYTVSATKVARFVLGFTTSGAQLRSLQYVMPGETKTAILTYTTSADRFDGVLDTFEASAQATTGLQNPASWRTYPLWARWGFLGACGGLLVGMLSLLKRRLCRE